MNLRRTFSRLLHRGLALLEAEQTEPRLNEAQRRTLAQLERDRQMRIEPGAYARPDQLDRLKDTWDSLCDVVGVRRAMDILVRGIINRRLKDGAQN